MVKEIQRINPVGLYDPSPNGYTHVAMVASRTAFGIAPPGATIIVVEGEVELVLDQRRVTAAPGALMLVPENTLHGFSNPGQTRSKLLIMFLSCRFTGAVF